MNHILITTQDKNNHDTRHLKKIDIFTYKDTIKQPIPQKKNKNRKYISPKIVTFDIKKVPIDNMVIRTLDKIYYSVILDPKKSIAYIYVAKNNKFIYHSEYEYINIIRSLDNDLRDYYSVIIIKLNTTKYVYVGEIIYEFTINDDIKMLFTSIDNDKDINHAYAYGINYIYALNFGIYIPINKTYAMDPYKMLYNLVYPSNHLYPGKILAKTKNNKLWNTKFFKKLNYNFIDGASGKLFTKIPKTFVSDQTKVLKEKIFYIHDNGGRPFRVNIGNSNNNKTNVKVYKKIISKDDDNSNDIVYEKQPILNLNCTNVFIGKDIDYWFYGSTILLQNSKTKYIFLGPEIIEFTVLDDEIIMFCSNIGSNDVHYSFAVGRK